MGVVIRLTLERSRSGFAYFGRLDALSRRLQEILGCPVDIVTEPVRKERLRRDIERDATLAFWAMCCALLTMASTPA